MIIHCYITFFLHMTGHVCIQNLLLMLLLPASILLFMKPLIDPFPEALLKGSNFPSWFSCTLQHYILKNNYYYRHFKKNKSDLNYSKFSYSRKIVKITIKSDRSRWLKSIDESLKNNPKKFWNNVSNFRNNKSNSFQLMVDGTHLAVPYQVAEPLLIILNQCMITQLLSFLLIP
jgi:hypothetical protein